MKRFMCLLILVCLLLGLWACGDNVSETESSDSSDNPLSESTNESSDAENSTENNSKPEDELKLAPDFSEMPETNADFCDIVIADNVALFAASVSGMDSSSTELISYDLAEDKLLSTLDLGDDVISVFSYGENFAVLSHVSKTLTFYGKDLTVLSQSTVNGLQGEIGIACLNGEKLLASSIENGEIYIFDVESQSTIKSNAQSAPYQIVGNTENGFVLDGYDKGLINVSFDGNTSVLYKKGSAAVANDKYLAGVKGDYITLLPIESGNDTVIALQTGVAERFCSAAGNNLLSHSQTDDCRDELYFYSTQNMTVSKFQTEKKVISAALLDNYAVAAVTENFGEKLEFIFVDFSETATEKIGSSAYDEDVLNGREPLPQPNGSEEALALINRYQQDYGVRVMWSEGFFDLESLGYTLTPTTEEKAMEKAILLEELLKFLPKGLLEEISKTTPVVIYLCEDVYPTAGGMNTVYGGYNILFLSVNGNDDYFLGVAAHEMGHALERNMAMEMVDGWRNLMPEEVREAYDNLYLTVEYTPDGKGNTPVWFIDAYGRTNEMEDRAIVFAYIFEAYYSGENSVFAYEGIMTKAKYWETMLEETYDCCKDITFAWEGKLN